LTEVKNVGSLSYTQQLRDFTTYSQANGLDSVYPALRSPPKIAKEGKIYMEDYMKDGQVRSFLVKGDTVAFKEELKTLGGRWNRTLGGWTFPKSKEVEVAEFLKLKTRF
jgi:hypothetical protein